MIQHAPREEEIIENPVGKGLGAQAYEALLDLIVSGELQPGDLIQERRLALQLDISRTPMREAMHRLEGERVLERTADNKLSVRRFTVQELIEALNVRRLLEPHAAARAAQRIPPERLEGLLDRVNALLAQGDPTSTEHQEFDDELHGLITESCDNRLLAEMIQELRRKTRMFSLKRLSDRLEPICREHQAIIEAMLKGDPDASAEAATRHIDNIKMRIIEKLAKS
jgi:DNA-binding GntR family transcriptional regulator